MASVALIANGICFAVMTVMFVGLGSAADYGSFGRWLLLVLTVVCWVFQYAMISIQKAEQWPAAMVFYIIAYIAYVRSSGLLTRIFELTQCRVRHWYSMLLSSQD